MRSEYALSEIQLLVLHDFPYPIAYNYRCLLDEKDEKQKAELGLRVFEYLLRSVCLAMISQYLITDHEQLSDEDLNDLLRKQLNRPSLGQWVRIFFSTLKLYHEHPDRPLFMKELSDLYWDADRNNVRKGIHAPFEELVQRRNDLAHGRGPKFDDVSAWQLVFSEIHSHLLEVFQLFSFLCRYELIHVDIHNQDQSLFERYKGLSVTSLLEPVDDKPALGAGWFYLAHREQEENRYLRLYPFFVQFDEDILPDVPETQKDIGFLENYTRKQVTYYAAVLWKTFIKNSENEVAEFLYNVDLVLQEKQKKARVITFEVLKEKCRKVSALRMEEVIAKYNPSLYLDREMIQKIYEDYVSSDKTCLVITGKSGVGKSNFVIATAEYLKNSSETCTLLYNGSHLPGDQTISEIIQTDLGKYLDLDLGKYGKEEDIWKRLEGSFDQGKHLILFIDGINENPEAPQVIQKINFLIDSNIYPWLKVVLTSRPEAWRALTRHIKLSANKYYWQAGKPEMGVEMEGFLQKNPLVIDKFSRDELEEAYSKYQQVFHLATRYDQISGEIRQELRDPLLLRLVAGAYAGEDENHLGSIPSELHPTQIYSDYIRALQKSERLNREDILFLEYEVLPNIMSGLKNALSEEEIVHNQNLYEKIFNGDMLSNGKAINRSFINLVDAEILTGVPSEDSAAIGFKYERFYDFYAGRFLFKKYNNEKDKRNLYRSLIDQLPTKPYLWGALKNALVEEVKSGEYELIYSFSQDENQLTRELLISVLTEYGREPGEPEILQTIISSLLKIDKENHGILKWLPGKTKSDPNIQAKTETRSAAKVALEVTRRLGLSQILVSAVMSPNPMVRVIAVRNIYYLWRTDRQKGYELFDRLMEQAWRKWGLPNIVILEACLGISILFMRHYTSATIEGREIGVRLLKRWREILRRLFFFGRVKEVGTVFALRPLIRSVIFSTVIRFIVHMQESYPVERPSFLREINDLLTAPPQVMERFLRLVDYFGRSGDISTIHQDLVDSVIDNDTLTIGLVWLLLILEYTGSKEIDYCLFRELAELDFQKTYVGMTSPNLVIALGMIGLMKPDFSDELYKTQSSILRSYLEKSHGVYQSKCGTRHPNTAYTPHAIIIRYRQNPEDINLLQDFLKISQDAEDWPFFQLLIRGIVSQATALEDPIMAEMAMRSLEGLFPIKNQQVRELLIETLAKVRIYYPEVVDDFLLEFDTKNELMSKVARYDPDEQPWSEIFQNNGSTVLLHLLQTPQIKKELVWVFKQAANVKSVNEYLKVVVQRLLNLIIGEKMI